MLAAEGMDVRSGGVLPSTGALQPAAARIARRVLSSVRPGRVIIFHDGFDARGGDRAHTVEAVRLVVDRLCGEGWRFATLDEPPFTDGAGRGGLPHDARPSREAIPQERVDAKWVRRA